MSDYNASSKTTVINIGRSTLYSGETFRVCQICRLVLSRFLENGSQQLDEEAFELLPLSEGVAIEAKCGKSDDGHDYYYVVSFVRFDPAREEFSYDSYLDRVADTFVEHPDSVNEFKTALTVAQDVVQRAVQQ